MKEKWVQLPEQFRDDFRYFLVVVWKHLQLPNPTPVQLDIAEYMQDGPKRRIIEAFRGVGKSWMAAAYVLWLLRNDPQKKIMVVSASKMRADDFAQFSVAMPKSWNLGTVTYQVFWSPGNTNTGNCIFGLQGVSCGDSDTIDVAFGTAVEVTDAGIGTVEDQQITSESSAMTVAGAPAAGEQSYFQLYRDAADGSDTFTGECRVLGIKVFFTTAAANDA